MDQIDEVIAHLKEKGIESFSRMGVLVIPVESAEHLDQKAKDIKRLLDGFGYHKIWSLDPYFYERQKSLTGEMYQQN